MITDETWPMVLFALRVGTVVLIYLFLFTAFRALRADLRVTAERVRRPGRRTRARQPSGAGTAARTAPAATPTPSGLHTTAGRSDGATVRDDDDGWETPPAADWEDEGDEPPSPARGLPGRAVAIGAVGFLALLGGTAFLVAGDLPGAGSDDPPAEISNSSEPSPAPGEPPTVQPAPGRVTVGLAAREDSSLRVTVDGVVQFEGVLEAGETQAWEGGERIQVWTDTGKTLQLAVNGEDLGAYSPAMGHPDWNRIDFGFWPGWAQ